jgi:hypothetical protein
MGCHVPARDISVQRSEAGRGKVSGTPVGCGCGDGVVDWARVSCALRARPWRGPELLRRRLLVAMAAVLASGAGSAAAAPVFRAGVYAVEITPRTFPILISGGFTAGVAKRAEGSLNARALALDDGARRIVISVVDTLMLPREMLDRVKQAAARATGVPPENMLICATHTHSAPPLMGALGTDASPEYVGFVEPRLVEAIAGALRRLAPARVGWTVVQDPEHTHCRRWILRPDRLRRDPFGDLTVRANMHPGYQNPDFIGPAGPVDAGLTVLAFESAAGRPLALLANYSMHYVGAPGGVVSPDYYGPFVENIQRLTGVEAGFMTQGTSGDQHWMDYSRPQRMMDAVTYAEELARTVHQAWATIRYRPWVGLAMAEATLRLKRRVPDAPRLAWARELAARMGGAPPKDQREVYAREQLYLAAEPERELKIQALRIGELGIAALPNEVFGITGLKIKAQSPLAPTFNIELANGAEGYIPPPEQHKLGGYTTWPARTAALEPAAEPRIVETALGLLEQVAGRPRRPPEPVRGPYARTILAARPLAYWRGEEFGGPVARDAGAGHHDGTYEGGVAFYLEGPPSPAFSGAQVNRAPQFAGGRLKAGVNGLADRYTVELWFWNGLAPGLREVTGCLFSRGADRLEIGAAGRLTFRDGASAHEGATVLGVRTWNHVVLARDRGRVAVYLNGDSRPEIAGPARRPGLAAQVSVGGGDDVSAGFEGRIDEIALFARVLGPAEAKRHFRIAQYAVRPAPAAVAANTPAPHSAPAAPH